MQSIRRLPNAHRRSARTFAAVLLAAAVACSDGTKPPSTVTLTADSGTPQTGGAGTTLALPLIVKATDAAGKPVEALDVTWAVSTGGGTVSATTTTTSSIGTSLVNWLLGTKAGTSTVTATVSGAAPVIFTATITAANPSAVTKVSGDAQTGAAGSALPNPLVVLVADQYGNPAVGRTVAFTTTGGNTVAGSPATTGADGKAQVTVTLGNTAGAGTVIATVTGVPAQTFSTTATARAASALTKASGDGQSATAGIALVNPLVAKVADQFGNPVAGATVTWAIASGGGTLSGTTTTTSAAGLAQVTYTLDTTPGPATVTATSGALGTVTFGATGNAPLTPAAVAKLSGDGQSAKVSTALANPLVVLVIDDMGNPAAGITVTWAVTGGGTVSAVTTITNANGQAQVTRTLGATAGTSTTTATVAGLGPVTFISTGTP